MATVLHRSKAKGTAKLVLVGIANHAGDGGSYPALATLATYANVDERTVRRALRDLERIGELVTDVHGGGRKVPDYWQPNLYHVRVACPPCCDHTTNHRCMEHRAGRDCPTHGVTPRHDGVTTRHGGGDASVR